jgi:hypothetical protein
MDFNFFFSGRFSAFGYVNDGCNEYQPIQPVEPVNLIVLKQQQ